MRRSTLTATITIAGLLALSSPVAAKGDPKAVSVAKTDTGTVILVAYDDGVVAFDATGQTYHKYDFSPGKSGSWHFADVNADGITDYVALSKKSLFAISGDGNPLWNQDGCAITALGNLAGEESLEVFCVDGRKIRVHGSDGSKVWEIEISGMSLGQCQLVELRGEGLGDVECKLKGKKMWLQLSGEGSILAEAAEAPSNAAPHTLPIKLSTILDDDSETFDFNGDGTSEEYLLVDSGDIVVQSRSSGQTPLAAITMTATAATSADIDGDGHDEVILAAKDRIVALDKDAEKTVAFDTAFNRAKLAREPVVRFATVGGYGLAADNDALMATIAPAAGGIADCYGAFIKKDKFLKVGRYSVRAIVGENGAVSSVENSYSTLNDKTVEECVAGKVKALTLPLPEEGASSSYATIDLVFGYRDK